MSIDKIVCVGKNYLEHAQELGDAIPEKPVLFLKPPSVLKQAADWGQTLMAQLPGSRGEIHHECEIVLRVAQSGYQMTHEQAAKAIDAVTVGLDMTLRTEQARLKKLGHPWTVSKVFIDSAIIGPWILINDFPGYQEVEFSLLINNNLRQRGLATQMLMKPVEQLVYISQFFPLCAGDIIFTGTPAGVAAITAGAKAELRWGRRYFFVVWR